MPQIIFKKPPGQITVDTLSSISVSSILSEPFSFESQEYYLDLESAFEKIQSSNLIIINNESKYLAKLQRLHSESKEPQFVYRTAWNGDLEQQVEYLNSTIRPELDKHKILFFHKETVHIRKPWIIPEIKSKLTENATLRDIEETFANPAHKQLVIVAEVNAEGIITEENSIEYSKLEAEFDKITEAKESIFLISNRPEKLRSFFIKSGKFKRIFVAGYQKEDLTRVNSLLDFYVKGIQNLPKNGSMDQLIEGIISWDIENFENGDRSYNSFLNIIEH